MVQDPSQNLVRLFVSRENISRGESAVLSEAQLHYLRNVMRMKAGDRLRIFNGRNGEWLAEVTELSKKNVIVTAVEKLREQASSPDVWAAASPVKKEAFDFMVEKASELGCARFFPVLCARTVVQRVNGERLTAIATEAAEQCERLDSMAVEPLCRLENLLETWPNQRKLIFCMERGEVAPIARKVAALGADTPLGVLVGPEGGFTPEEAALVAAQPFAVPVSLGPRILKAETALVAALACIQSLTEG